MSELNLIWAEDLNGWIGKDNTIPWHVSADMKHFKTKTTGHPMYEQTRQVLDRIDEQSYASIRHN